MVHEEEAVTYDEIDGVLEEYHKKKLLENMSGPAISLIAHITILTIMFIVIVKHVTKSEKPAVVEVVKEDKKIPPPKEKQKIKKPVEKPSELKENNVTDPEVALDAQPVDTTIDAKPETPNDMEMQQVNFSSQLNSPLTVSNPGGSRLAGMRKGLVAKRGGSEEGQKRVNIGLRWLAKVQNADGSWGEKARHARTGMATLCFLALGETPSSSALYGETVRKACEWMNKEVLKARGVIKGKKAAYQHGILAYALSEAYGMTQNPKLRESMEIAIKVIIDGQQTSGGFDYNYRKGDRYDVSVAGWNIQALKAAYVAGSKNPGLKKALDKSVKFLKSVHSKQQADSYNLSAFEYSNKHGKASPMSNMTGIATVCLQLLGHHESAEAKGGVESIMKYRLDTYKKVKNDPSLWATLSNKHLYGWYYDTQAAFNTGGDTWKQWRDVFEPVLIKAQNPEGSWSSAKKHHGQGNDLDGKILTTTWSLLQLAVYTRNLPTFDNKQFNSIKHGEFVKLEVENPDVEFVD